MNKRLGRSPVNLEFIVEKDKKSGLLTAIFQHSGIPDDAVLLTYAFTGKIPTGYHIMGGKDLSPFPYGQLLVDTFGGDLLFEKNYDNSKRVCTFELHGFRSGEFSGASSLLMNGITHLTGESTVVSNERHVPLGVELSEYSNYYSRYFALSEIELGFSDRKFVLVIAQPSEVNQNNIKTSYYTSGSYFPFRILLTPSELGEYMGKIVKPLSDEGKIKPNFSFA